ncbi:hypothetical protein [Maribacter flavus]|uniref:Uncharacterized protein n=1 Tax=Maribacter flavus TaxID=1658664 RepID=A0A5B2TZD9_9FLAO|nr:hypothetical protein [Maribacter flavus]KAA2219010.1 hypothetical protein F0361_05190 [Maribacter flavus]
MGNYKRSICSTCRHAPYCSLTTDMGNISSCSDYWHYFDDDSEPEYMVSEEMMGETVPRIPNKEPILS